MLLLLRSDYALEELGSLYSGYRLPPDLAVAATGASSEDSAFRTRKSKARLRLRYVGPAKRDSHQTLEQRPRMGSRVADFALLQESHLWQVSPKLPNTTNVG
jgi:hypothetical protein